MMFRQALADLKDRYPQRLQVIHLFSQESMDSDLLQGRIDGDKLRRSLTICWISAVSTRPLSAARRR
jgi:ferredoxin-NADP reductase